MKKYFKALPEDLRNIMTLVIGNGLALSIPVLVSPFLSRIYNVEDFGLYTVYIAVVSIITSFSTGRYDYAILVAKTKKNAYHLFLIAVFILSGVAGLTLLMLWLFKEPFLASLSVSRMGNLAYLIPVNIFLFALYRISQNGLNREREYNAISASKSGRSFIVGGLQLSFGWMGYLGSGLIISKIIGDLVVSSLLSSRLYRLYRKIKPAFSRKTAGYLLSKYKKFPKINTLHAFINALSLNSIPLLIGFYFGEKIVGFYGLSYMVCVAPVQLVGTAVYQVFSQKISVLFNEGQSFYGYTKKTLKTLFLISVVPFTVLFFFGPEIFQFVFGEKWIISGEYVQILAPYLFLTFLLTPLTYIPLVFNEHEKALLFEVLSSASKIISIIAGAYLGGITMALIFLSASGILIHIATLVWVLSLSRKHYEAKA